jgi:hypothetical protein
LKKTLPALSTKRAEGKTDINGKERTPSYPAKYKTTSLNIQIFVLKRMFPQLETVSEYHKEGINNDEITLPSNGAEGWFAIPRWQKITKSYAEAVDIILKQLKDSRKIINLRVGEINDKNLREYPYSEEYMEYMSDSQNTPDILIVPAQFGLLRVNDVMSRVRTDLSESRKEFPLGSFAVGSMLLTNPDRLRKSGDLELECAGDEFCDPDYGQFDRAPCFSMKGDRMVFGSNRIVESLLASSFNPL